ncbi:hypothetical protein [Motilimonas pumila]|uniref:Uncharacterized protein n=1 Tax=Motilimonas pumila TaxID=2303987 RepID=A0A418YHB6_9GAMM|nr:hypothetical protein [Motilimonas pumila]RJG49478.1 hypothetical protein D1Z90_05840 [Motilimonas pumila]
MEPHQRKQAKVDSRRKFLVNTTKIGAGLPLMASFFSRSAMGGTGTCYTASAAQSITPSAQQFNTSCIASGRSPGYYKTHVLPNSGGHWNLGWPQYSGASIASWSGVSFNQHKYLSGAEQGIPRIDGGTFKGINKNGKLTKNAKNWFKGTLQGVKAPNAVTEITLLGSIPCFQSSALSELSVMEVLWRHPGSDEFIAIATYFNTVHALHDSSLEYPIDYNFACELITAMLEGRDDEYHLPNFSGGSIKVFLDSLYV